MSQTTYTIASCWSHVQTEIKPFYIYVCETRDGQRRVNEDIFWNDQYLINLCKTPVHLDFSRYVDGRFLLTSAHTHTHTHTQSDNQTRG